MNELTYGSDNEKGLVVDMLWANSADSHVLEPADLWTSRLPARYADRAPRTERTDKYELTSFQHDSSAVPAYTAMGYRNIMWGDDYPHLEGTYGHTQETLHKLFDDAPPEARDDITVRTFERLFRPAGRDWR